MKREAELQKWLIRWLMTGFSTTDYTSLWLPRLDHCISTNSVMSFSMNQKTIANESLGLSKYNGPVRFIIEIRHSEIDRITDPRCEWQSDLSLLWRRGQTFIEVEKKEEEEKFKADHLKKKTLFKCIWRVIRVKLRLHPSCHTFILRRTGSLNSVGWNADTLPPSSLSGQTGVEKFKRSVWWSRLMLWREVIADPRRLLIPYDRSANPAG